MGERVFEFVWNCILVLGGVLSQNLAVYRDPRLRRRILGIYPVQ